MDAGQATLKAIKTSKNFIRSHVVEPIKRAPRLLFAILLLAFSPAIRAAGRADRVVVVANGNAQDSVSIARHYAAVRGVPPANVIVLTMPLAETISWKEFVSNVWQPLEDELVARGWIDALAMNLHDEVGRRKYAFSGHRIEALVVCRGVPLRIENEPSLYRELKPLTEHPEFRTNEGAVDSELSLLAQTAYSINASIPNPLFGNTHPSDYDLSQVVKVSRLDGPSAAAANGLVDLAVEAERTGLLGRAYVDMAGPHRNGNHWLEDVAKTIGELGFDMSVTRGPGTLPESGRFDAPALYFGWYAPDINGPFSLPGFRFPPGAVAVHIHSFSAHTLRSSTEGWCGPMVARGVTATLGNVFEPYLEYSHRLDLFMEMLARGEDLVDAAYFSLPVLSWQSIVIGDPLYRPFATSLASELKNIDALPQLTAGYAVLRSMNLLDAAHKPREAIAAGKDAMNVLPSLALALGVGRRLEAAGNEQEAVWMIKAGAEHADASSWDWELVGEAAQFLSRQGRSAEAIDLYRKLLSDDRIPISMRSPLLVEARRVALESGDTAQAARWKEEMGVAVEKSLDGKR